MRRTKHLNRIVLQKGRWALAVLAFQCTGVETPFDCDRSEVYAGSIRPSLTLAWPSPSPSPSASPCGAGDSLCCGGEPLTPDSGLTCCSGLPANLASDATNCGECGKICKGNEQCLNGECSPPQCPQGATCCEGNGVPTDTSTDYDNCGQCGNQCDRATIYGTCIDGMCGGCREGINCCGGEKIEAGLSCCSGHSTDLKTDRSNCGRCGSTCYLGDCKEGTCFEGHPQVSAGTLPDVVIKTPNGFDLNATPHLGLSCQSNTVWHGGKPFTTYSCGVVYHF